MKPGWLSSVILFDARAPCLFHARPLQGPLKYDVEKNLDILPLPFSAFGEDVLCRIHATYRTKRLLLQSSLPVADIIY